MLVVHVSGMFMGSGDVVDMLFERFCFDSFCSSVVHFSSHMMLVLVAVFMAVLVLVAMVSNLHMVAMVASSDDMSLMNFVAVFSRSMFMMSSHTHIVVVVMSMVSSNHMSSLVVDLVAVLGLSSVVMSHIVVMVMSMVSSNHMSGLVTVLNLSGVVVSHLMCMLMASSNRNMALMSYMAVVSLS